MTPGWGVARPGRRAVLAGLAALLVGAALLVARLATGGAPVLIGTDLGGRPAPDFTLTDHRGQTVRLSDFRGRAVVLTFIYATCPDVCPITAENLRTADELLPAEARDRVALLAVTVDPARDTRQALQEFTGVHRLAENARWYALRGDPAALEQVWSAYGIYPGRNPATPPGPPAPAAGGGEGHTDGMYFIDPDGRERAFLRSSATPQEIAANLMTLLD